MPDIYLNTGKIINFEQNIPIDYGNQTLFRFKQYRS